MLIEIARLTINWANFIYFELKVNTMEKITSESNKWIKHAAKLGRSHTYRREQGQFLIEGVRLCFEAAGYAKIVMAYVAKEALEKYSSEVDKVIKTASKTCLVPMPLFRKISGTKTPQGIICVCEALDKTVSTATIEKNGKYLILENLSDPGNMGTIMRTADALGMSGLILAGNCADIYSPKVVRSTMGAIFRLPVYEMASAVQAVDCCHEQGLRVWGAVVDSGGLALSETYIDAPCAIMVGNEGHGLSREAIACCDNKVTIDMAGHAESLNASVAASILMWEVCRGRR